MLGWGRVSREQATAAELDEAPAKTLRQDLLQQEVVVFEEELAGA